MLVSSAVCTDGKEVNPESRWPPLPSINMQFERFHITRATSGLRSINVWSSYAYNWNCSGGFPCSLIVDRCCPAAQSVGFFNLDIWYFFLVLLNDLSLLAYHCTLSNWLHCSSSLSVWSFEQVLARLGKIIFLLIWCLFRELTCPLKTACKCHSDSIKCTDHGKLWGPHYWAYFLTRILGDRTAGAH